MPLPPAEIPAWIVERGAVHVGVTKGSVTVDYTFRRLAPRWSELRLAGPELVLDAAQGPLTRGPGGTYVVLPPDQTVVQVHLSGTVPAASGALDLALLPGPQVHVEVEAPGQHVTGLLGGALPADGALHLRWSPAGESPPGAPLALGEVGVGAWAAEGAVHIHAKVRWRLVRGEIARFAVEVGELAEVAITGPNVARFRLEGGYAVVEPVETPRGLLEVEVTGTLPLGHALPGLAPEGTVRTDRYVILGRPDEGETQPETTLPAVGLRTIPPWARALTETTAMAAWRGSGAVTIRSATFETLLGPDTVVERAEFELATSADGRSLLRGTWWVRNERRQYLHLRPPEGGVPLTARVSGSSSGLLSDGSGGVYVPLEKSVETMLGPVSFPVEVTWLLEGEAWARRGKHLLTVPSVDAPIQSATWRVSLPRDVFPSSPRATLRADDAPTYAQEADQQRLDSGKTAWLNAVDSYKDNNFEDAQEWLEVAKEYLPGDDNVTRLESNIAVLIPDADGRGEDAAAASVDDSQARRVRELANAKTVGDQIEQAKAEEEAEEALLAGDVTRAAESLEKVAKLADRIAITEQRESRDQSDRKADAEGRLAGLKRASTSTLGEVADKSGAMGPTSGAGAATVTVERTNAIGAEVVVDESASSVLPVLAEPPVGGQPVEDFRTVTGTTRSFESVVSLPGSNRAPPRVATAGKKGSDAPLPRSPPTKAPAAPADIPAATTPAPATPAPVTVAHARTLTVDASPFTPALPMHGPLVHHEQALLLPDESPTFTYHPRGP